MYIISIVGCFIVPLINFFMKKKALLVSSFFSLYWGLILLLSYFSLFNVSRPRSSTFLVVFMSVVCFEIASIIFSFVSINNSIHEKREYCFNPKIFWLSCIICCIFIIPDLRKFFYVITNHVSVSAVYNDYIASDTYREYAYGTALQYDLMEYIGYPIMYSIIVVSIISFFKTKKISILIPGPFFSIISFFNNGQRTILVIYMLIFLVCFFLYYKIIEKKSTKRILFIFIVLLLLFILVYSLISNLRGGTGDYSFFENLYKYYVGCVRYLDLRLKNWNQSGLEFSHGFYTFRGVLAPFVKFLELFGVKFNSFELATTNFYSMHGTTYDIGGGSLYNSYGTCFFVFFADFGYPGIFIFSFIYGMVSTILAKKMLCDKSIFSVIIFGYYFAVIILFSNLTIYTTVVHIIYGLIFTRLYFKRKKQIIGGVLNVA